MTTIRRTPLALAAMSARQSVARVARQEEAASSRAAPRVQVDPSPLRQPALAMLRLAGPQPCRKLAQRAARAPRPVAEPRPRAAARLRPPPQLARPRPRPQSQAAETLQAQQALASLAPRVLRNRLHFESSWSDSPAIATVRSWPGCPAFQAPALVPRMRIGKAFGCSTRCLSDGSKGVR